MVLPGVDWQCNLDCIDVLIQEYWQMDCIYPLY